MNLDNPLTRYQAEMSLLDPSIYWIENLGQRRTRTTSKIRQLYRIEWRKIKAFRKYSYVTHSERQIVDDPSDYIIQF